MGARVYDPSIGRFTSRDPVPGEPSEPRRQDPYAYALSDPLRYYDLDGRFAGFDGGEALPAAGFCVAFPEVCAAAGVTVIVVGGTYIVYQNRDAIGDAVDSLTDARIGKDYGGSGGGQGDENGGSSQSRGSTGRTQPRTLKEQLAMDEVKSNPGAGKKLSIEMSDPRWPRSEGWVKMQQRVNGVNIHYVYNRAKGIADDFKFVD